MKGKGREVPNTQNTPSWCIFWCLRWGKGEANCALDTKTCHMECVFSIQCMVGMFWMFSKLERVWQWWGGKGGCQSGRGDTDSTFLTCSVAVCCWGICWIEWNWVKLSEIEWNWVKYKIKQKIASVPCTPTVCFLWCPLASLIWSLIGGITFMAVDGEGGWRNNEEKVALLVCDHVMWPNPANAKLRSWPLYVVFYN